MKNKLQHLTNDELLEYYELYKFMIDNSSRAENTKIKGMDTKFAYNVVRLVGECKQLLTTGTLDLQQDRERLKAIRRGEWTQEQVREFFNQKERELETVYNESSLPYSPDEEKIKDLLVRCLELQYGDLSNEIVIPGRAEQALREIQEICERFSR